MTIHNTMKGLQLAYGNYVIGYIGNKPLVFI